MRDEEGVERVQDRFQIGEHNKLLNTMRGDIVQSGVQSRACISSQCKSSSTSLPATFQFQRADKAQAWPTKK